MIKKLKKICWKFAINTDKIYQTIIKLKQKINLDFGKKLKNKSKKKKKNQK